MTSRRHTVSISSIRRANQSMIEGKRSIEDRNIPVGIKGQIRARHYSADEINASYARAVGRARIAK